MTFSLGFCLLIAKRTKHITICKKNAELFQKCRSFMLVLNQCSYNDRLLNYFKPN